MRKYIIYYWAERNDEATDLEEIIEADNIEQAIQKFKSEVSSFKRITTVTEICYES
jgi:hypothetical protein